MATWHQAKRPVKLFHDTLWTAIVDPTHGTRCAMLFSTEAAAQAYVDRCKALRPSEPAYVLAPASAS